jgi:hypothetical protein
LGTSYDAYSKKFRNEVVLPFNSPADSLYAFFAIIDITNLDEVSYGFVHLDPGNHVPVSGEDEGKEELRLIPIDAKTFVWSKSTYRGPSLDKEAPETRQTIDEVVQNLERSPLTPRAVVASLWNLDNDDGMLRRRINWLPRKQDLLLAQLRVEREQLIRPLPMLPDPSRLELQVRLEAQVKKGIKSM